VPRGRLRSVSCHEATPLADGWQIAASAPGAVPGPHALDAARLAWLPARVPGTAASALRDAGAWSLDGPQRRFDAEDWWYRVRLPAMPVASGEEVWLCCDGLATVAEAWLNGTPLFTSGGMFAAREYRIDGLLARDNELVLRFVSLDVRLAGHKGARRPRPRWRAPMVENQGLRLVRTTLLGRTPGWSPPAAAVGPWREVRIERRRGVAIDDVRLAADGDGRLEVACRARPLDGGELLGAEVVLARGGREVRAALERAPGAGGADGALCGRLRVADAALWWPHTHGEPALYETRVELRHAGGLATAELGPVGFRSLALDTTDGDFALRVNGVPVFCRGACWTPLDPVSFRNDPRELERAFAQVVAAGMNMLRVGGTMVYEDDAFLDRCDAHGVLLWHDLMFANLDYPADDPTFAAEVELEAAQALARWQARPSLAVVCGNGEGEQQAAMWGAPRASWRPPLFHDRLARLARDACPGVPYWPASAHGGAFPHQPSSGTCSYYGVGAYLRPLEDARRAEVRFASECLAFANVPEGRLVAKVHDPAWKARSPRDLGVGWDFDDVRDHYVARLFRVDPVRLRFEDHDRYLELSRVATGEVMAAVFAEWRRRRSVTRGGLVWFLRDLWHGAGFGVVDAAGRPKAAWHYLRRALAPVAVSFSDEGCSGLFVHVANDRPERLAAEVELALFRGGEQCLTRVTRTLEVAPHGAVELAAIEWLDGFADLNHAHRFGPMAYDLVTATLRGAGGEVRGRAFFCPGGLPSTRERDLGLGAEARRAGDGEFALLVRARRFAQSVRLEVEGFAGDDDFFHLAPGDERRIVLRREPGTDDRALPQGTLQALNAEGKAAVVFVGEPAALSRSATSASSTPRPWKPCS